MVDLDGYRSDIETEIKNLVVGTRSPLFGLDTMNAYHMGFADRNGQLQGKSKGKYMRPLFCTAICGGLCGDPSRSIPAAASLEIAHRTSLVFDDIQDVGEERNGDPTVWKVWGTNQAINAGLVLSSYARQAAQKSLSRGVSTEGTLAILAALEEAVIRLCGGQYLDLSFEERTAVTINEYLGMVAGKTGALFAAAAKIGAICATADSSEIAIAEEMGMNLGIAFQIWDDYLGIWGDASEVGKTPNDLQNRKRSYPIIFGRTLPMSPVDGWLSLATVTPEDVNRMKTYLTSEGMDLETKAAAQRHILIAYNAFCELDLLPEWREVIDQVMALVATRVK